MVYKADICYCEEHGYRCSGLGWNILSAWRDMDEDEFIEDARFLLAFQTVEPIYYRSEIGSPPALVAPEHDGLRKYLKGWATRVSDEPNSREVMEQRLKTGIVALMPDPHPKVRPCALCRDGQTTASSFTAVAIFEDTNPAGRAMCDPCVQEHLPGLYAALIAGREAGAGEEQPVPEPEKAAEEQGRVVAFKKPESASDDDFADLPF